MPRLVVDVDGTLLKGQHGKPYGYQWNHALIRAIHQFRQMHPDWGMIIWSMRGAAHARTAAARAAPDATTLRKQHKLLRPDDIVVDNNPKQVPDLGVVRRFFSPDEFARMMLTHR